MNWYIGQKIVCIKADAKGKLKEGKEYIISGLQNSFCKCKDIEINVGIYSTCEYSRSICNICNGISDLTKDKTWWFSEKRFAPLEEIPESHEKEVEELIKELCQIH